MTPTPFVYDRDNFLPEHVQRAQHAKQQAWLASPEYAAIVEEQRRAAEVEVEVEVAPQVAPQVEVAAPQVPAQVEVRAPLPLGPSVEALEQMAERRARRESRGRVGGYND